MRLVDERGLRLDGEVWPIIDGKGGGGKTANNRKAKNKRKR